MKIVLGVTASISAYKSVEIMRIFQKNGHEVSVVMTENSKHMVTEMSFEAFIPGKVYSRMFEPGQDPVLHINLGKEHDMLLIAPASANIIGKIANGLADDLLSATAMAFPGQIVVSPAMNVNMYENRAVQENLAVLRSRGVAVIEPEEGRLACGDIGKGLFPAPEKIFKICQDLHA